MGAVYEFICLKCGYSVECEGGFGGGFVYTSQDVLCHDCREIRMCVTARHEFRCDPKPSDMLPLQCPVDSSHRIEKWDHPGPCPRCGTTLQEGTLIMESD